MELIERILSEENINEAIRRVKSNKGAPGVDKMTVNEIDRYFEEHKEEIKTSIMEMKYKPQPVRRVYIPKANGKKRPLGIPTVRDRVIQQMIAQELNRIYEPTYSIHSYGFRRGRDCHGAIEEVLQYLNEGYEWVIDLDIEKYFDTVNHDKLISILREKVNDKTTLHLIRSFLRAGIMEDGLVSSSTIGVPQGGPLSPELSNIYLDQFDKELESRGLRFVRYADDCNIFVKSEMAAERVMKSVTSWLERKLFLKVSAAKTKIVRPPKSNFLGFSFWKGSEGWKCRPADDRKKKLYAKTKDVLNRRQAVSRPLSVTFTKLNQIIRGWINYFRIGNMKAFLEKYSEWMRHKVRVVIIKQWKKPRTIYVNLQKLKKILKSDIEDEKIYSAANSRKGWFPRSNGDTVNYLITPDVLATRKKDRPGLIDPLKYYLSYSC